MNKLLSEHSQEEVSVESGRSQAKVWYKVKSSLSSLIPREALEHGLPDGWSCWGLRALDYWLQKEEVCKLLDSSNCPRANSRVASCRDELLARSVATGDRHSQQVKRP